MEEKIEINRKNNNINKLMKQLEIATQCLGLKNLFTSNMADEHIPLQSEITEERKRMDKFKKKCDEQCWS